MELKKEKTMKYLKRFKEPSTMAGLAALGLLFGLPPGTVDAAGQVLGGVAALLAIFLPEGSENA